jgi:protein TonB
MVQPVYPAIAKAARVQGKVTLTAIIGKDGKIQNLQVTGGPAMLRQSAIDAVSQWEYRPTILNGEPVDIITDIEVNFILQ